MDPFTGATPGYSPPAHYSEIGDLWSAPPPMLPGTDPEREPHYARGSNQGPLYLSKTILGSDPMWLRLAYTRYPVSARDLTELLAPFMPPAGFDMSMLPYIAEIEAVRLLRARGRGAPASAQEERVAALRFHAGSATGSDVLSVWSKLQHLAISVAWAWGVPKERQPPAHYFYTLADEVANVYHDTQRTQLVRLRGAASAGWDSPPEPFPLDRIQSRYRKYSDAQWQGTEGPPSLAKVAGQMSDVIGEAGTGLEECRNCGRVFQMHDSRQAYCSPYCRTIFNRAIMRAAQKAGAQDSPSGGKIVTGQGDSGHSGQV